MKKLTLILILSIGFFPLIYSQTVDSIKVEQAGEFIKIHYKILNSNQYQTFRVTLYCSINNGLKSELKSLVGDFGENVIGGKSEYIVMWDVLKDVDEVNSVDFSVKAELVKGDPSQQGTDGRKTSKRRTYLFTGILIDSGDIIYGGGVGFMGSWGFSISPFFGVRKSSNPDLGTYEGYAAIVNITKRIVNNKDYQLHLLAGLAFTNNEDKYANDNGDESFLYGYNLGLVCGFKRLAITAGFSNATKPTKESTSNIDPTSSINLGIGIRF